MFLLKICLTTVLIFTLSSCRPKKHTTDALIETSSQQQITSQPLPNLVQNLLSSASQCVNPEQFPPSNSILGGQITTILEYPFLVSLNKINSNNDFEGHHCSGSFIAPQWIVTSAHCFFQTDGQSIPMSQLRFISGRSVLTSSEGQYFRIQRIIIHPSFEFHDKNPKNDLALVQTIELFTSLVGEIIPTELEQKATIGMSLNIMGWGHGLPSELTKCNQLSKNNIFLSERASCDQFLQNYSHRPLELVQICAKTNIDNHPCQGDRGGPIMFYDSSVHQPYILGIASFTPGCENPQNPNVYTYLHHFRDWITQNSGI